MMKMMLHQSHSLLASDVTNLGNFDAAVAVEQDEMMMKKKQKNVTSDERQKS
jgi:hypothetical protein